RKIAAMLVGNADDLPEPLTHLSTTGLLRAEHPRTIERWIDAATGAGLIRVSTDQYRTLSLTSLGRELMAGRVEDVQLAVPEVRQASSIKRAGRRRRGTRRRGADKTRHPPRRLGQTAVDTEPVEAVSEALRAWRLKEARDRAIPPFVILHDRTVAAIATVLPRSLEELHAVPGVGPAKLAAYGEAILSVVAS